VADHRGDTWRSVYTVPKKELELIRQRLAEAERDHTERQN
jgi:hypothetical protein